MSVTLAQKAMQRQAQEVASLDPPGRIAINHLDLQVVRFNLTQCWCQGPQISELERETSYSCRLCLNLGSEAFYRFGCRDWIFGRVSLVHKEEAASASIGSQNGNGSRNSTLPISDLINAGSTFRWWSTKAC